MYNLQTRRIVGNRVTDWQTFKVFTDPVSAALALQRWTQEEYGIRERVHSDVKREYRLEYVP